MTTFEAFDLALQRYQAGRLADAEVLCRQILAAQPNHADALHLLGVIACQIGRNEIAVECFRKAIAVNPVGLHSYLGLGNALVARGHLDQAIDTYRRAIEVRPDFPQGHTNLGNILRDQGRLDEAIAAYRRAIEVKPDLPEAHNNLGNALRDRGRLEEAIAAYRRAIEVKPDLPEAHTNLGNALSDRGRFDEAIAAYRRAIQLRPSYPQALNNLGAALAGKGQFDEAVAAYRRALQIIPECPEAFNNLGAALRGQGQLDEALAAFRRAVQVKPDFVDAHYNLGSALRERGQFSEAIAAYRRAIQLKPGYPDAYNNLGVALRDLGELDQAIAAYRHALQLDPGHPEAHNNLGEALQHAGRLDDAVSAFRRALELKPDFPDAICNLGRALKDRGELDEAIAAFRCALLKKPERAWLHSDLIYTLHYHPGHDNVTVLEEHQRWNRQFSEPLKQSVLPHANDRRANRPLRIGYVSPDFREHAVGRFVLPLIERHDRERFEILCYSGVTRPDWITERFRSLAAEWRNTVGVSDARLAEMIRNDGVDILVDLALHTANNRLPVFARQPAPVQATWLGYPGSTGLPGVSYRLTDARMDPPGESPEWSSEDPVRLPDCWCCYNPLGETPEVNALPALSAGAVTFGSLNNFAKVNEGVLARWARTLAAVKGSRLLMYCPEGLARERVRAFFGAQGIASERLEMVSFLPRWEYLRLYHRIDIGLDPSPYNGMTTTCDALWMGTPVLTLPGAMPASRAGLGILSSIGLGELAASSEEDYVRLAVELAEDLPRLAELRAALRPRMLASPLMDAPRFARNVEAAYRSMWQRWRSGESPVREA